MKPAILACILAGTLMCPLTSLAAILDPNNGETHAFQIYNTIMGDTLTSSSQLTLIPYDELWHDGNPPVVAAALYAGNTNAFGVYTDDGIGSGSFDYQITTPTTADGFLTTNGYYTGVFFDTTANDNDGDNLFGFYVNSSGTKWRSESSLNSGSGDQMVAVALDESKLQSAIPKIWVNNVLTDYTWQNAHMLFWEDVAVSGSDKDYNDLVVIIDVWSPGPDQEPNIPEPATLAIWSLFGAGAAAVGAVRRRRGWTNTKREAIYSVIDRHSV